MVVVMYTLFVGSNDKYLAKIAIEYDQNAKLLDILNFDQTSGLVGTYYTSLADLVNLDIFFDICTNADKIFYHPPASWNNQNETNKTRHLTESVIGYCSQHIEVKNFNIHKNKPYFYLEAFRPLERKTAGPQIWVAGCSFTQGVGVTLEQTWKEHVSKSLDLEYTDLSKEGTSITWSADRILRSDIRPNDIVFWQLTGHHRNFAIDEKNDNLRHILLNTLSDNKIKKNFPMEYVDSKTTICKNILSIQQVYNFCQKAKAKLVILGTLYDWENHYLHYNIPCFEQLLVWPKKLIDLGSDNMHPGPEQHKVYAKKFIELLEKHYKDKS